MNGPALSLWAGKLAMGICRVSGRGGTTWPGRVATSLDPGILKRFAGSPRLGCVVVTGTNGKTGTALFLSHIARAHGLRPIHNRAGANMASGVISAFLEDARWSGKGRGDVAVLEVDEASLSRVAQALQPRAVVVTNFCRDQLDRYGEVETTVASVRHGIERCGPDTQLVLCSDDPLVAWLGDGGASGTRRPALYFGLQIPGAGGARLPDPVADATQCVRCGAPYHYERAYYAHLGHYACGRCGHGRPLPHVRIEAAHEAMGGATAFELCTPAGTRRCRVMLPGLHNLYNALAAAAASLALGLDIDRIAQGVERTPAPFGRLESFTAGGRRVVLALVKNPTSFNAVLRTVMTGVGHRHMLFALNDLAADGRDVSWIWDVDFERAVAPPGGQVSGVVCSGRRAEEMAVRLKYAGVSPDRLVVEPRIDRAIRAGVARLAPGETLFVLPTYTAMLEARRALASGGLPRSEGDA